METSSTIGLQARQSRRGVLAGASAMALAMSALRMRSVMAEDGTPVATPAEELGPAAWLFTQTFTGGDWAKTDDPTKFTVNFRGGVASTIGFTDRPHRDFAIASTSDALAAIFLNPDNPPNAAVIVEDAGTQYTFVIVLNDPVYDEAADQVTYTASVLDAYESDGLGAAVERVADGMLPQTFGAGALFIDSIACWGQSQKACRRSRCDNGLEAGHLAGTEKTTNTQILCGHCDAPGQDIEAGLIDECNAMYPDWCYELGGQCWFVTDTAKYGGTARDSVCQEYTCPDAT